MANNSVFQSEAVQVNALMSMPGSLANSNSHESEEDDGPSSQSPNQLSMDQIQTSFAPSKDDIAVKQLIRGQNMNVKNPIRPLIWKHLYLRLEALAGSTTDPFNAIR